MADKYESSQDSAQLQRAPVQEITASHSHSHSRFAPPKNEEDIRQARETWVPLKTVQDTKFGEMFGKPGQVRERKEPTNNSTTWANEQHTTKHLAQY